MEKMDNKIDIKITTLDNLFKGEKFEVIHLTGTGEIKKRLLDMGFISGAQGTRLHKGLLKDPLEIELGSYKISIRKSEASKIHVVLMGETEKEPDTAAKKSIFHYFQRRKNRQRRLLADDKTNDSFYIIEKEEISQKNYKNRKENRIRQFFSPRKMLHKKYKKISTEQWKREEFAPSDNVIRIAIGGNPNTGKSSLFNALTGSSVRVGNYPGVTVDTKRVKIKYKDYELEFIDLPGTYSLNAYSYEEVVSRDFILYQKPDVVLDVLDATNLDRNLYLCLQFQELGVPIVGALNMIDEAEKKGVEIDSEHLSNLLQIPFVKTSAYLKKGIDDLLQKLLETALKQREVVKHFKEEDIPYGLSEPIGRHLNYGRNLEEFHNQVIEVLAEDLDFAKKYSLHWMAIKLIEKDEDAASRIKKDHKNSDQVLEKVKEIQETILKEFGVDSTSMVVEQRYGFIKGAVKEAVIFPEDEKKETTTEKIDKFALHPFGGILVFFGMMYLIYSLTFAIGNRLSDYVIDLFEMLSQLFIIISSPGLFQDFIVEGVIGGVGGVVVFLPIILMIFAGLSFLEDSGYLARAAFVMDKFMHQFGMHGRSFIPLMISTGCAVPAVMSTRALASQKDRIITAIVLPMMMCTAKTPVIAMLVSIFFTGWAGFVFWLVWFFAWIMALISALILNKTIFLGDATPFVMELPPYRFPTFWGILKHMWNKAMGYLKKAGTIILAASIITWILFNFPRTQSNSLNYKMEKQTIHNRIKKIHSITNYKDKKILNDEISSLKKELNLLENKKKKEAIEHSFGGRIGKSIQPFFQFMGFDWKMAISLVAALPAKEIVISTMGIVYGIGEVDVETGEGKAGSLKDAMKKDKKYNSLVIIAFMIFVLIYTPCFATLAVIKRELGGWRWVFFSVIFSIAIASILSIAVYQIGSFFI